MGKMILFLTFVISTIAAATVNGVQIPSIGKWMLQSSGETAHWVGLTYMGRTLDEPINVVIRVEAATANQALQTLIQAASKAGFTLNSGHSSGYFASIEGKAYAEVPDQQGVAFSDGSWLSANDHGRFFGPVLWKTDGKYYFVGALSREGGASPLSIIADGGESHAYLSFTQARTTFVKNMVATKKATIAGKVFLNNVKNDDGLETTGDHDGYAVVLDL